MGFFAPNTCISWMPLLTYNSCKSEDMIKTAVYLLFNSHASKTVKS